MDKVTPTSAELEILNILWKNQPLTVREVHDEISKEKEVGYTTTLKIMQNMTMKGLLNREQQGKSHLYYTVQKKEAMQTNLLNRFIDSAFLGSASSLVMNLLGNKKASKSELDKIKKIIKDLEDEQSNH